MNQHTTQAEGILSLAKEVLKIESAAVSALSDRIGDDFVRAVQALLACRGRVVVTGIGKSGHIARKIAATMASTGTPAFFVHAAEASHGDLGMITREDVVIGISYSKYSPSFPQSSGKALSSSRLPAIPTARWPAKLTSI